MLPQVFCWRYEPARQTIPSSSNPLPQISRLLALAVCCTQTVSDSCTCPNMLPRGTLQCSGARLDGRSWQEKLSKKKSCRPNQTRQSKSGQVRPNQPKSVRPHQIRSNQVNPSKSGQNRPNQTGLAWSEGHFFSFFLRVLLDTLGCRCSVEAGKHESKNDKQKQGGIG